MPERDGPFTQDRETRVSHQHRHYPATGPANRPAERAAPARVRRLQPEATVPAAAFSRKAPARQAPSAGRRRPGGGGAPPGLPDATRGEPPRLPAVPAGHRHQGRLPRRRLEAPPAVDMESEEMVGVDHGGTLLVDSRGRLPGFRGAPPIRSGSGEGQESRVPAGAPAGPAGSLVRRAGASATADGAGANSLPAAIHGAGAKSRPAADGHSRATGPGRGAIHPGGADLERGRLTHCLKVPTPRPPPPPNYRHPRYMRSFVRDGSDR